MEIQQIKESCLYVKDLDKTLVFYEKVLGFKVISYVEGRHVFFRVGQAVLLCFIAEITKEEKNLPPHFAYGRQHIAFEVALSEYAAWKEKLKRFHIEIIHEQHWKENLYSCYFYDPDQHVLEILPPGIWE